MKWCILGGISVWQGPVASGNMQLYSIKKKASQPMKGHAASFLRVNLAGRTDPAHQQYSYLLDIHTGKLCIVPESLNRPCSLLVLKSQGGQALLSLYAEVQYTLGLRLVWRQAVLNRALTTHLKRLMALSTWSYVLPSQPYVLWSQGEGPKVIVPYCILHPHVACIAYN